MPLGSHHQRKQPSETRKGAESKKANEEAAEIKGAAACSATFAQDSNPPPPVAKDKSASPEVSRFLHRLFLKEIDILGGFLSFSAQVNEA